jgi:hypothetical protein
VFKKERENAPFDQRMAETIHTKTYDRLKAE